MCKTYFQVGNLTVAFVRPAAVMELAWKVWHQVLSYFSDVRDLCRLEQVSRSVQRDIRHYRWGHIRSVSVQLDLPGSILVLIDGKQFPKRFPLETGKYAVRCLMERAWKLTKLEFLSDDDPILLDGEILSLLTTSSSRSVSNLGLALSSPNAQIPEVISKFSQSLTFLAIKPGKGYPADDGVFLSLAAAIGSCHKLESLCIRHKTKVFVKSPEVLERGLSTILGLGKLKNVDLRDVTLDLKSNSLDSLSLAFSKAILSSPAMFETLEFAIDSLSEFLQCYWQISEETALDSSQQPLQDLRFLHWDGYCRRGDLSLLVKICPNLKSLCVDVDYALTDIKSYVVAYLQQFSFGHEEKRLQIDITDVLDIDEDTVVTELIAPVTAQVHCDMANYSDDVYVHFRKRNAVVNVLLY